MPKDSQPDNKGARKEKSKNQTPITAEGQNHNKNTKKQSAEPNDVQNGLEIGYKYLKILKWIYF